MHVLVLLPGRFGFGQRFHFRAGLDLHTLLPALDAQRQGRVSPALSGAFRPINIR